MQIQENPKTKKVLTTSTSQDKLSEMRTRIEINDIEPDMSDARLEIQGWRQLYATIPETEVPDKCQR
jgi:hypothetical protein